MSQTIMIAKTVQLQNKLIPLSKKMCTSVLQRQRVPFASVERKEAPNSLPVSPRTGCQVKRGEKESGLGEKKAQATLSFSPLHLAAQAGRKTVWSFLSLDASKANGQKQTNKQTKKTRRRRAVLPSRRNSPLLLFEQYRECYKEKPTG